VTVSGAPKIRRARRTSSGRIIPDRRPPAGPSQSDVPISSVPFAVKWVCDGSSVSAPSVSAHQRVSGIHRGQRPLLRDDHRHVGILVVAEMRVHPDQRDQLRRIQLPAQTREHVRQVFRILRGGRLRRIALSLHPHERAQAGLMPCARAAAIAAFVSVTSAR